MVRTLLGELVSAGLEGLAIRWLVQLGQEERVSDRGAHTHKHTHTHTHTHTRHMHRDTCARVQNASYTGPDRAYVCRRICVLVCVMSQETFVRVCMAADKYKAAQRTVRAFQLQDRFPEVEKVS